MEAGHGIRVFLGVLSPFVALFLLYLTMYYCRNRCFSGEQKTRSSGDNGGGADTETGEEQPSSEKEQLITFPGGEHLTVHAILDAPGEVVAKSSHSTLYKAWVDNGEGGPLLLRFVRPWRTRNTAEVLPVVNVLGSVRHSNLVPLQALYLGSRGEKLLVHPFFPGGTLFNFLTDGSVESCRWEVIHKLSMGIARGLDHLHNGLQRPLVHGNLHPKNVLLDADHEARLSDFSLHFLLSPNSGQEMLEASASEGYRAPELIKMKDASKESDVYSLGVVFLAMATRKVSNSDLLPTTCPRDLPNSVGNKMFHRKISEIPSPGIISQGGEQTCVSEEGMLMYLQLAITCCSPLPSMRPDIKQVLQALEEIRR